MSALLIVSGTGLLLSAFVSVLFLAMFAASHPADTRERPRVPPPDVRAVRQQDTPGLVAQPPLADHAPPPSGGSSRAEG